MTFPLVQPRSVTHAALALCVLALAGCDRLGGEQLPPKKLLGAVNATPTTVADPKNTRLVQLAAYFDDGRWKKVDDTTYTLRVARKDPTSDKPLNLGFLIKEEDQAGGSVLAEITHATLNGEDASDGDVLSFVDELDLPPVPAGYPPLPPDWRDAAVAADPKDPPGGAVQKAALAADHLPPNPAPTASSTPSPYVTDRPAVRSPADLSAFRGMAYKDARAELGAMGFTPASIPRSSGDESCGIGQEEICRKYPESVNCTGMGLNPCRAVFVGQDGRIVVASTEGDEASSLTLAGAAYANAEDQRRVHNIIAGKEEDAP